jgi:RNA polymerase sigma-70 factor (ECF subfamily)
MNRTTFEREAMPQLDALHHFALLLCRDKSYSRDLVQETMLKAFTYFDTYREGTNCRAWLFQICKNSYINDLRRRQLQPVAVDFQSEETGDRWGDDPGHAREIHVQMGASPAEPPSALSDEVADAFASLPADYQTALILCDMEGFAYEEIAAFMRVPVGTVRSRIHRARKILESKLGKYARSQGYIRPMASCN